MLSLLHSFEIVINLTDSLIHLNASKCSTKRYFLNKDVNALLILQQSVHIPDTCSHKLHSMQSEKRSLLNEHEPLFVNRHDPSKVLAFTVALLAFLSISAISPKRFPGPVFSMTLSFTIISTSPSYTTYILVAGEPASNMVSPGLKFSKSVLFLNRPRVPISLPHHNII